MQSCDGAQNDTMLVDPSPPPLEGGAWERDQYMMYWYQWYTLYLQETNSTNDTRIILTGLKGDSDYTIYVIKFFSSMHDHANVFGWGCSIYLKVTITCQ